MNVIHPYFLLSLKIHIFDRAAEVYLFNLYIQDKKFGLATRKGFARCWPNGQNISKGKKMSSQRLNNSNSSFTSMFE